MRALNTITLFLIFLTFGTSSSGSEPSVSGQWVGGYEFNGSYTPIRSQFVIENGNVNGTICVVAPSEGPVISLEQIVFRSSNLHFAWQQASRRLTFDGQIDGDIIKGTVQDGSRRGSFQFVRSLALDSSILDQYVGEYKIGKDSYVLINRPSPGEPSSGIMYSLRDSSSPELRSGNLFPTSETTFVAGPARWVPYPVEIKVNFVKNKQGEIILKWKPSDSRETTGRKVKPHLHDEEEVKFQNGDVTLAGTLSLPLKKGPHPAIVVISGSTGGLRGRGLPQFFAQHGIATLAYDKRGYGTSTGTFAGVTLNEMAGDAAAGVRYLQSRNDIDPRKVGVWSISQGGWIAPIVANTTPTLAFIILHAGPAVSPRVQAQQELESEFVAEGFSPEEIKEAAAYQTIAHDAYNSDDAYDRYLTAYEQAKARSARWVWKPPTKEQLRSRWIRPNLDFDPVPFLEKVKCPVLAFFGEKDPLVPPKGNVAIMQAAFTKYGNKDVTIKVLPRVNHLFQLPGMGTDGYQSSGKTPAGYYDVMIRWIKQRVGSP